MPKQISKKLKNKLIAVFLYLEKINTNVYLGIKVIKI